MKASDAVDFYGSRKKLGEAVGVAYINVAKWVERGDRVPIGVALKLQDMTRGKLKTDMSMYRK